MPKKLDEMIKSYKIGSVPDWTPLPGLQKLLEFYVLAFGDVCDLSLLFNLLGLGDDERAERRAVTVYVNAHRAYFDRLARDPTYFDAMLAEYDLEDIPYTSVL